MKEKTREKVRMAAIVLISLFVIVTGSIFSYGSFINGEIIGGTMGIIISVTILGFAIFAYSNQILFLTQLFVVSLALQLILFQVFPLTLSTLFYVVYHNNLI